MKMRLSIIFLITAVIYVNLVNSSKPALSIVDNLRYKFIERDRKLWPEANNRSPEDLVQKYQEYAREIDSHTVNHYTTTMLDESFGTINEKVFWKRMYSNLRTITQTIYNEFLNLPTTQNMGRERWMKFIDNLSILTSIMKQIQNFIEHEDLFGNVLKMLKNDNEECKVTQSLQQAIYNIYNIISLSELKAYLMAQFCIMLEDSLYPTENHLNNHPTHENILETFQHLTKITMKRALATMNITTNEIWKCDPQVHIKNETYTELTQLLQGYLENEVDMNERSNCLQNCAYYDYSRHFNCFTGICKEQKVCRGKILKCQYIKSDMTVCTSDSKSGRRYDYIEYDNGRTLGRITGCSGQTKRVESWWRWLFWHCSYCICLCDDDSIDSDRYFSLREVKSDLQNNMVVTGIKFTKVDKIIHLQIQESKLLSYGAVDRSTTRWQSVKKFGITDSNIRMGIDYHSMSYENRDIDLDDIKAPDGFVVTGVKFRVIGTHLNFEIHITPFNFTKGALTQPHIRSYWESSDNTISRQYISTSNLDIPTRTLKPSKPDSAHDHYLEFTNSDLDRDVGQTTVPFIDIQPVDSAVTVPLSGAGIYHKGQRDFGGFVAPKIFTYDFSKHMKESF